MNKKGFTLIELVVIIVIVLIAGGAWYLLSPHSPATPKTDNLAMYASTLTTDKSTYHVGDSLNWTLTPDSGVTYSQSIWMNLFLKRPDGSSVQLFIEPIDSPNTGQSYNWLFDASVYNHDCQKADLSVVCTPEVITRPFTVYDPTLYHNVPFQFDATGTWVLYTSSDNVASATFQVVSASE